MCKAVCDAVRVLIAKEPRTGVLHDHDAFRREFDSALYECGKCKALHGVSRTELAPMNIL